MCQSITISKVLVLCCGVHVPSVVTMVIFFPTVFLCWTNHCCYIWPSIRTSYHSESPCVCKSWQHSFSHHCCNSTSL